MYSRNFGPVKNNHHLKLESINIKYKYKTR